MTLTAPLQPQHQRTLTRLYTRFAQDPAFPAMIVGGSLAKGRARPDSDVDIIMVATDEEEARRAVHKDWFFYSEEFTDYAGGYVDGKVITQSFLEDVAARGSETARAAFTPSFLLYSRLSALEELLSRIGTYPEQERDGKLAAFFSQVLMMRWFIREAEKRGDAYLLKHSATEMALFGSRLLLAYNRILFPFHKWLMYEVGQAAHKPEDFMLRTEELLHAPSLQTAQAYVECLSLFHDWGVTHTQAVQHFLEDSEWSWRTPRLSPQDW